MKRDRAVVLAGLLVVTALAWIHTGYLARRMESMGMDPSLDMAMPDLQFWGALDFILMLAMWAVMMVAMMMPSAAPMIVTFARVNRSRRAAGAPFVPSGIFALGYAAVWTGFSLAATFAQWSLETAALLSADMKINAPMLGGGLLIAAGVFQWTPLKEACLAKCRSPFGFVVAHWREGPLGAFHMGIRHGAYCLLCCWALMALLFVNGVMNLLWIAALAVFALLEKTVPRARAVARVAGAFLVGWGFYVIVAGLSP